MAEQNIFKNKYGNWALITGASNGIGKDFVFEVAKREFNLILVARNKNKLNEIKNQLVKEYKIEVNILEADLSNSIEVKKVIANTQAIDVGLIILAAGFGTSGDFTNIPIEEELNMIDLNCRAVVELTHHYANKFKTKKKGGIVLFGSLVGFQGVARTANYAATKAFIQSFAEGIRTELLPYNVDVISCAPGPIKSGFGERAKMKMGKGQNPEGIANETLNALGKKMTVRPGMLSKILGYSLSTLPRFARTLILNKIMSDMTSGNNENK
jgi:short-subunit dehydrogenase